jgi:hypothetical protein
MKTIEDYMNDPEIVKMPEYLREIHAARRMIQDETRNMTPGQRREYLHTETVDMFSAAGITPRYADFTGQGRVKAPAGK